MKKALKIAGITVGVILILLLVLPFAFQGKIEKIVKQEGNKMLNAQFDFSALNISLLRNFPSASVTLEDFYLKGTGAFENDTLIQAGELLESQGKKSDALKIYQDIKTKYVNSPVVQNSEIDKYIERVSE